MKINITDSFRDINNSAITINLPKHEVPKILTPQIGLANDINFIGRNEDLQKVDEFLNQDPMLLLLNGIGGIGKSTLASYYMNKKKDDFDYYGFVQVNEDIKLNLSSSFKMSLNLESEKIDDLFAEIMVKLQNLKGKKLLIIDDIKDMDSQLDAINSLITLKNSGFQILFTSRETQENIPQHFLDTMTIEDARDLFLSHYTTDEIGKIDKILEYLDYHTLFIEITAKTLKQRKRTLSLDKVIIKFADGEFSSIKKNKKESFNLFLTNLFSNDKILKDDETVLFLKKLSVLPSTEISFDDLYKFLVCEDEEKLEISLMELINNGWLIESNSSYKFHQILKEFIWEKYTPIFQDIQKILSYYNSFISSSNNIFQTAVNNRSKQAFFYELSKYLLFRNIEHLLVGDFFLNLGIFYQQLEEYQKALILQEKASTLIGKLKKESLNKASADDSLAILYKELGKYYKALPLYLNALRIRENILGTEDLETATSYNNLGIIYRLLEQYDLSMDFNNKNLKIKEKKLNPLDPSMAQCYNNIAMLYDKNNDYKNAIIYYNKALKIWEKVYGENHQDTAKCYNNLGVSYINLRDIDKAIELHTKALNIRKLILGETNYTAQSYFNLAAAHLYKIKSSEKSTKTAIEYFQNAIAIWERVNPTNPQLIEAKKFLDIF
jgi:tetratricopeptide (TPR) repeat protein